MTLEQLDVLRGYAIATVILSLVGMGIASVLPSRVATVTRIVAQFVGGIAGLALFAILNCVAGWDEYFLAKSSGESLGNYSGRHGTAARIVQGLGELNASALGIVFGLLGLALVVIAVRTIAATRRHG